MARRIVKHATRGIQTQAALDPVYAAGQRVMTIDGLPGRILFVATSFAPGLTEYEVMLDHGMGHGTYTSAQLRPLPADFRAGPPGSNLPAGVTAAMEAEAAGVHLASEDYPEMGSILHDRPDPGLQIQVVGHRRAAADSYGGAEDPRDEDYNGGENDAGVDWAAPAQQGWMHENEPQQEAPPPVLDPEQSPVLARLAQIEEACQLIGTRHSGALVYGTTINGTEIDGHGDAPEHGQEPRAEDPEDYDSRSTEGEEDEEMTEPLHDGDNEKYRGATTGLVPSGVSDGGIGMAASRVPWTGHERTELHRWDNGASTTQGDFVPSTEFTNRQPVTEQIEDPAPDVIEQELRAQGAWRAAAQQVAQEHDAPSLDEPDDDSVPDGVDPDETVPGGTDPDDPSGWPMAQAEVTSGGTAFTQGTDDGQRPWGGHKHRSTDSLAPTVPRMMQQLDQATQKVQQQQNQLDKLNGPDDGDQGDGSGGPSDSDQHLAAFTAAAGSPEFRFEFTAAWPDVLAKAKRIRKAGRVRLTHASAAMVIGEVAGDHDTYEAGIQRPPGHPQTIQHWACGCPWATFNQDSSLGTRYAGRPCSHVMAVQLEAQARSMFGRQIDTDPTLQELGHDPYPVVVRSVPPWTGNGWAQHWLAPAASLHTATPDEARDWDWSPEERDLWEQETEQGRPPGEPGCQCFYQHEGPCPDLGDEHLERTAESLRHSRPPEFHSEITPNPQHDPHGYYPWLTASHVMTGHMGSKLAGRLHFSVSDDGKAHEVNMLHTRGEYSGRGVASAMMDDLYSHVHQSGGMLNHGVRTDEGNNWWSSYREPHPEVNIHHQNPDHTGWDKYWDRGETAAEMTTNYEGSGGQGAHTPPAWSKRSDYEDDSRSRHDEQWTHARGIEPDEPYRSAVAALVAAGEDLGEIVALAQLAGITVTADQANGAWGSENVSQHPPVKPYGATEPPNKDQDPGSYGFLSAPDPENWGSIQEDSIYQSSPMSTDAALLPGGAFGQDAPADPDGLEADLHEQPEPALPATTGDEMGDQSQAEGLTDQAQTPSPVTQEPGMGSMDDALSPDDPSIQTIGAAQTEDDIVAAFQRSAGAKGLGGGGSAPGAGDIAAAAREFLSKTADVLPEHEAAALINEGRGERARNLSLLKLEGTHYAEQDEDLHGRGLSLDDFDDDVVVV